MKKNLYLLFLTVFILGFTINSSATCPSITGTTSVCIGATTTLANTTTGGTWASSSTVTATVGDGSGIVTGVRAGTTTITYTASCGTVTTIVTVVAAPPAITLFGGTASICVGASTILDDATSGGTWSSGATAVATVGTVGGGGGGGGGSIAVVYGVGAGTSAISYTSAAGCAVVLVATVSGTSAIQPNTATICVGSTVSLIDTTLGGTWSIAATSTHVTVGSTGIVTGVSAGTGIITYTEGTGTCAATHATVTVVTAIATITPTTSVTVCAGNFFDLADATSGGTWSSGSTLIATVIASGSAGGHVYGVTPGTSLITYSIGGGCTAVTKTVTVIAGLTPLSPHNPSTCEGDTVTLSDGSTGGTWTSSNTAVATILAYTSTIELVTGASPGTAIIELATGSCNVTDTVTITAGAGIIAPSTTVTICVGSTTTLTNATSGGVWSSNNTAVVTVSGTSGTATISGAGDGTATIYYTLGACIASREVSVTGPVAISPHDPSVCVGGTVSLTDATSGGSWTSEATSIATITSAGVVTGALAGEVQILYRIGTAGCFAQDTVFVTNGAGTISASGTPDICVGATDTLSETLTGGTWTSSNTGIATVSSGDVITGAGDGTTTILYTLSGCSSSEEVTVRGPVAISPHNAIVCLSGTTSLTDGSTGGTWSSDDASIASVTSTGIVTGAAVSTTIINYVIGTCSVFDTVTVISGAGAISPSGTVSLCQGSTTTLIDGTTGGVWSSNSTGVATVSGGIVDGVTGGTAIISYTLGSCSATSVVSVIASSAITPATAAICIGGSVSLTEAGGGGTWSSSNSAVALVSSAGVVTGTGSGITTITWHTGPAAPGGCTYTAVVTVNPVPGAITPSGTVAVCSGSSTTLADGVTGGSWSSLATGTATVSSSGAVYGIVSGTVTISYSLGTCGVDKIVNVVAGPGALSSSSVSLCAGSTTTLTSTTSGGTWSSTATGVATVAAGVVGGIAGGTATIDYTVGSCIVTATVTVIASPPAITPSGATSLCANNTVTLGETATGGVWSSSNTALATVAGGIVSSLSAGTVTISYTVGSCPSTKVVTILPGPAAILPASPVVCTGTTLSLTETSTGGAWASSSTANATVSSAGVVYSVAAGTATIQYSSGSCSASTTVTVENSPAGITPTGAVSVCDGTTTTLTDVSTGGIWSSGATGIATVSAGGIVGGIASGTVTISYSEGACSATKVVTVSPAPTAISPPSPSTCAGNTVSLTESVSGGTWSSSSAAVATVGATGIVSGVGSGTVNIYYIIGSCVAITTVNVSPSPSVGTVTGSSYVCVGSTNPLSDLATGGVWSSSNVAAATVSGTGVVYGVSNGTTTISYSNTSTCGLIAATLVVSANSTPIAGTITGETNICAGTTASLSNTVLGGTWFASNSNASVTLTGGLVTGVTTGLDTITYKVTTPCGIASTSVVVTVGSFISAGSISGSTSLCGGTTIALTVAGATGGVWSSSNSSASVSSTGIATGAAAGGADTIYYIVTATCGADTSTQIITVNPDPAAGSISSGGISTICVGTTVSLAETVTGGAWSTSNGNAEVTGDIVAGVTAGAVTISYTYTNSCGSAVATEDVTIIGTASAGTITGPSTICSGAPVTLADGVSGGVWSSSNTAVATVTTGGLVTVVSGGSATISYSVSSSCGTTVATYPLTASGASFSAGTILGISSICVGTYTVFADSTSGGTWSSSNSNVTVTTSGLPTAVVTGEAVGTSTISYTVANSCGTAISTQVVSISGEITAGVISGQGNACIGYTDALTESVSDGVWSTSNTNATVSSAGVVSGVTAGMDTVFYTVTSTCGTVTATFNISADATGPTAGTISGPTGICAGNPIMFTNDIAGGVWSVSNTHATISSSGLVNGVTIGTDIITYTVTTPCGTAHTTQTITIGSSLGVAAITGSSVLCDDATVSLADLTTGGTWSIGGSNATVSTVGVVSGVTAGTAIVTYSVVYSCGTAYATKTETVNLSSGIASISGPDTVCQGTIITLSDVTADGVWSVGNTNATITTGGVVAGVNAGTAPISYTVNSSSCGFMSAIADIYVAPTTASLIGPISSLSIVCVGSGITLVDPTPGGTWEASNGHAIVVGAGIIDGISPGADTISYVVTGTCGIGAAIKVLSVDTIPIVPPIMGSSTLCLGSTIGLSDPTSGGEWTTSSPAVGTVGAYTGVVTGVSFGVTTVTYTYTNLYGCPGSVTLTATVTPATLTTDITGSSIACLGGTVTLSDATGGGTWASSNPSIAAIGPSTGIVTGIASGTATISYTALGTCGIATITSVETVEVSPVVPAISGTLSVCIGATTVLSDATADGLWSSGSTGIAVVDAISGAVTGLAAGTDEITYSVANSCGLRSVSASVTVYSGPAVDPIAAAFTALCTGGTLDVSDATTGGVWASTNTAIASVSSAGAVLGNAAGIDTVFYVVSNSHGCSTSVMISITVGGGISSATVAPVGSVELCPGNTDTMNVTSPGGITYQWLRNGASISGATASGYSTSAAGNYAVAVSNGACSEIIAGPTITPPILPAITFTAPDMLGTGTYTSYQWFLNGVLITGATANTYDATGTGLYTVVVTDAGGCSDTSAGYSLGALGVNGISVAQNIKVYPNPATSLLHIDAAIQVNVSVMSIDGKVLIQKNNTADVDVSSLADGIYMIQVYDQSGLLLKTTKFAKME